MIKVEGRVCGGGLAAHFDPTQTLRSSEFVDHLVQMSALTNLELAVLDEVARQVPSYAKALKSQFKAISAVTRLNTGAGFYTVFEVAGDASASDIKSPVGDVGAKVAGLRYGMGFLLWMKDGVAEKLEGYSYEEDTSFIDFETVHFAGVGPRRS